ncbi:MAG TPA: sterol desaturase family protein [Stellaceae bacterium]|nr:sterol desaturase family protein [Stellaceae bacterium]
MTARRRQNGSRGRLGAAIVGFALAALVVSERRRPLRRSREAANRRDLRNLAVAAAGALAIHLAERPVVEPLARLVRRRRWGLLQRLALPPALELVAGLALLDYTLFLWHILTHRVPFLWRFHLVHHADLDLSASTALRFHFAELALSAPWRAAQVLLLGIAPRTLSAWQLATLVSILFHHSNLRLPGRWDRRLGAIVMTPRLHGIHHSAVRGETNSNWSSGLTLWDRLHSTLRQDVPQAAITIGLPAYRDASELTLPRLLALPFGAERPAWEGSARAPDLALADGRRGG